MEGDPHELLETAGLNVCVQNESVSLADLKQLVRSRVVEQVQVSCFPGYLITVLEM